MFCSNTVTGSSPKLLLAKRPKLLGPVSGLLPKVKPICSSHSFRFSNPLPEAHTRLPRRISTPPSPSIMLHDNPLVSDVDATAISFGVAFSLLSLWQETAKRGIFDQKLNRKLVHVSIGLAFMLCWPLFSSRGQAPIFAALIPGVNIFRMLLIGLGIQKDEATVKSMSRFGDYRELLKGPLYYASAITFACVMYWRSSPLAIALICNLCAGDGDLAVRTKKIPYNRNKSWAGSIAMASAGFLTSIGYMHYFSSFGYIEQSWRMILGFLIVSVTSGGATLG